jgi:hypothetical protein
MDNNYNWNNPTFSNRCEPSLNLAVNGIANILYTLYQVTTSSSAPTPTFNLITDSVAYPTPIPSSTTTSGPTNSPIPTQILSPS